MFCMWKEGGILRKVWKWLDNFWYHYKWQTLIVLFFVVVLAILIGQMTTKEESDLTVLYAGPKSLTATESASINTVFSSLLTEDFYDDGKKNASLIGIWLLTDEQVKSYSDSSADDENENNPLIFYNAAQSMQALTQQVSGGDAVICLLDPYWYRNLRDNNSFVPLRQVLGTVPSYAVDEYAVRLSDTPFGQYYTALSVLPEDTLVAVMCERITTKLGSDRMQALYQYQLNAFRAMMQFTFPEGYVTQIAESETLAAE